MEKYTNAFYTSKPKYYKIRNIRSERERPPLTTSRKSCPAYTLLHCRTENNLDPNATLANIFFLNAYFG